MHQRNKNNFSKKKKAAKELQEDIRAPLGAGSGGRWGYDVAAASATGCLLLGLYLRTLHPTLSGGDSGELIVAAHEFGVAHPPGYPLFTLCLQVVLRLLPFGSIALRANALNAVLSACAGAMLQLSVLRLTRSLAASVLALALFSLSRLTWTWATSAEVFALNNLLTAAILLLYVEFDAIEDVPTKVKIAVCGAFVCGLGLCNQHTIVVYVGWVGIYVLGTLWSRGAASGRVLCWLTVALSAGLLPYAYLPLSALSRNARSTWGDQTTLAGFTTHLLRSEYGTFSLGKNQDGSGFLHGLWSYVHHLWCEQKGCGLILAVISLLTSWKQPARCKYMIVTMVTTYTLLFAWRANLDIRKPLLRGVVERFWMQSNIVVALLAAVGFTNVISLLKRKLPNSSRLLSAVSLLAITAVSLSQLLANFAACDQSANHVVAEFAERLLMSMPRNSLVFCKGDLPTISMRYLHLCENVRPDIQLVDVEILSYEWALPMLRQSHVGVVFPADFWHLENRRWKDGRSSFNFRALIDSNIGRRPVFVCTAMQERDASWQLAYQLWPYGACSQLMPTTTTFDPWHWANVSEQFVTGWQHQSDAFPESSWEKVANDEMWNAKISGAYFMYDVAMKQSDEVSRTQLLAASHQLYSLAISAHTDDGVDPKTSFPPFWHRNMALVCERLLHLPHDLDKVALCEQTVAHFESYLALSPRDESAETIRLALPELRTRVAKLRGLATAQSDLDAILERRTAPRHTT